MIKEKEINQEAENKYTCSECNLEQLVMTKKTYYVLKKGLKEMSNKCH